MKMHESDSWKCLRSAGSHSEFDVVCYRDDQVKFIQVKFTSDDHNFAKEQLELTQTKLPAFCLKELWIKRKNKGWAVKKIGKSLELENV